MSCPWQESRCPGLELKTANNSSTGGYNLTKHICPFIGDQIELARAALVHLGTMLLTNKRHSVLITANQVFAYVSKSHINVSQQAMFVWLSFQICGAAVHISYVSGYTNIFCLNIFCLLFYLRLWEGWSMLDYWLYYSKYVEMERKQISKIQQRIVWVLCIPSIHHS